MLGLKTLKKKTTISNRNLAKNIMVKGPPKFVNIGGISPPSGALRV